MDKVIHGESNVKQHWSIVATLLPVRGPHGAFGLFRTTSKAILADDGTGLLGILDSVRGKLYVSAQTRSSVRRPIRRVADRQAAQVRVL